MPKPSRFKIVGRDKSGALVISGRWLFFAMDSMGISLDDCVDLLRTNGLAFDVVGLVQAAKHSGNFTLERILSRLEMARPPKLPPEVLRRAVETAWARRTPDAHR